MQARANTNSERVVEPRRRQGPTQRAPDPNTKSAGADTDSGERKPGPTQRTPGPGTESAGPRHRERRAPTESAGAPTQRMLGEECRAPQTSTQSPDTERPTQTRYRDRRGPTQSAGPRHRERPESTGARHRAPALTQRPGPTHSSFCRAQRSLSKPGSPRDRP